MQESIVFLVRVQRRRKESSRSLSHLLMSLLSILSVSRPKCFVISLLKLLQICKRFPPHLMSLQSLVKLELLILQVLHRLVIEKLLECGLQIRHI